MSDNTKNQGEDALSALGEKIKDGIRKAAEQRSRQTGPVLEVPNQDASTVDDFNILPMPDLQEIHKDCIEWTWNPSSGTKIHAYLYTQDTGRKNAGEYEVEFFVLEQEKQNNTSGLILYDSDTAKHVAQDMLSAANWINVWKEYVGQMLEKSLGGPWLPKIDIESPKQ